MTDKKIKVLIVDDSNVSRALLAYIIESDSQLSVMGFAEDGVKALEFLKMQTPDVITMDIVMPNLDGFEVTRQIMGKYSIPIVIVSGIYDTANVEQSFHAIEAGALAILPKPNGLEDKVSAQEIVNTIKSISEIRLPVHLKAKVEPILKPLEQEVVKEKIEAVAIGASLGGPPALASILSTLPTTFPVPIFVVQHISLGFTAGLVAWLKTASKLNVKLAEDNEKALPGNVYIAPDACQMEITTGNVIKLQKGHTQPSVAKLFLSMAENYGAHGMGIILTGMGDDGAQELLLMKKKGAFTVAQDAESCVLFGMPRKAIALGAARRVVPLQEISSLMEWVTQQGNSHG